MSQINLSFKHGRTLDDARSRLQSTVTQVQTRFSSLVQRVEWDPGHSAAKLFGRGFDIEMRVDEQSMHLSGNLTVLGGLLSGPLAAGLKQIVARTFLKRLA